MHLSWDYLDFEGFRSFVAPAFLDFYKIGPGLHFMRGENHYNPALESNGAGKSSVWGALGWCLWGRTVGGLNRNDIKTWPRVGKASPFAEVGLFIDKKQYRIRRTSTELMLNDKIVPQERISQLLGGMNADVFYHAILLGQRRDLFFDLPPGQKLELFASILNLDRWDDYSKKAGDQAADQMHQLYAADARLSVLQDQLKTAETDLDHLREDESHWEAERRKRLKASSGDLASMEKHFAKKQRALDDAKLKLDSAGTEQRACDTDLRKLDSQLAVIERDFGEITASKKAKSELLETLLDDLDKMKRGGRCPACGQRIQSAALGKHKAELEKRAATLREAIQKPVPAEMNSRLRKISTAIRAQEEALKRFTKEVDKWQAEHDFLSPMVAAEAAKIAALKEAKQAADDEVNPYTDQRRAIDKRLRTINQELDDTRADIKKYSAARERAQAWVKGFKEVKLLEVEECLHELEITTNAMLDEMGLVDWQVRYAIEKETKAKTVKRGLNVMILSPDNDKEVKWDVWSGGESQRLRVAGALALGEVLLNYAGITTDMEILDEPTHAVSPRGIIDVCDFLADRAARMDKQIFLTDQHALQSPAFTSMVNVIRDKKGRSTINY